MSTTDLHYLGLVEVGQQIHTKKLSPVEVTKAMLERIGRLDGKLKSYAHIMADPRSQRLPRQRRKSHPEGSRAR